MTEDDPVDTGPGRATPPEPTPETARIVAYRGPREDPSVYVVVPEGADGDDRSGEVCWLLDAATGELRGPMPVRQATKFNRYERYETPPAEADDLIAAAWLPDGE